MVISRLFDFKMFDKDNSGKLSVHEIINIFGGEEESWKKVIQEIDLNKDGEVDFNEFKIMMTNIDKNVELIRKLIAKKETGYVDGKPSQIPKLP